MRLPRSSRCLALLLGICLLASFAAAPGQAAEDPTRELVVFNWSEYLDPELVAEFEQQFDVKVKEIFYEDDEARDLLMLQTDAQGYDLVLVDDITLPSYVARGWLAPIAEASVPNLKHVEARWRTAREGAKRYGVPYFWGTIGIAYRSDLVSQEITSWAELFRPAEELRGRISMMKDTRDLVGIALAAIGHSPNDTDRDALAAAEDLLLSQRPFVQDYTNLALNEQSALVTGEVWAAMMYNGDALMVQQHHEDIVYVVPEEGTLIWTDYLVVPEASTKKDLAFAFINFLNEPENAARLAEYVYYPSPNMAAADHLPAEFLEDEAIYPGESVLLRSEPYRRLPARALKAYAMIATHVVR